MYEVILQELVEPGGTKRFLGNRTRCRYCGATDAIAFGKATNAHAFPAALGNRTLFSLDECKACNTKFSVYEDALCKAVGPFLTLGGVRGRNGVRHPDRPDRNRPCGIMWSQESVSLVLPLTARPTSWSRSTRLQVPSN